ncbi:hypothetical protein SH16_02204 [Aeromonas caviae]|nr:hypothetical protein SH16_02204 [Aeromonas caviae]
MFERSRKSASLILNFMAERGVVGCINQAMFNG